MTTTDAGLAGAAQRLIGSVLHAGRPGTDVALATRTPDGWEKTTYRQLAARSQALAAALASWDVHPGDRVAILAEPGGDWVVAFFAILGAGAVVVPLDSKLQAAELAAILDHAQAVGCLTSPRLHATATGLPGPAWVRTPAEAPDGASMDAEGRLGPPRSPDDVAILSYTSGTTGRPKGVEITFANLSHQVEALTACQDLHPGDVLLSILPLSHMLELTCGLLGALRAGATVCHSPALHPHEVGQLIRDGRVSRMVVVPLFLRLLKKSIELQVRQAGPVAARAFALAHALAARLPARRLRRLLFGGVHRRLGGRLAVLYCGGAPLDAEVAAFFERMGVHIYQGYGLTETSPVVAMNSPAHHRPGSVGRPLTGLAVAIAADGEILVRGPSVMRGYFRDPERTAEAVDADGWLHTGDLGRLDPDGFLYVTGRAKNLIVLDSGKKVQPEEVEEVLAGSGLVAEVCVLGRRATQGLDAGWEQVCAVVVPSDEARREHPDPSELERVIRQDVRERARVLAAYKRPAAVVVHHGELPKTATRKLLRPQIAALLASQETRPA
jgi:long-chain acyl-CoA synthetase